jgi:hypothetical protein
MTRAGLISQIDNDPTILARYVHAFHLTPDTIERSFSDLKLVRLPEDRICQVHYVHPGEQVGYRIRRIRKGTAVWVSKDGTPVLAWVCGNPLRTSPAVDALGNAGAQTGRLATIPDFNPDEDLGDLARSTEVSLGAMRTAEPIGVPGVQVATTIPTVAVETPMDVPAPVGDIVSVAGTGGASSWAKGGALVGAAGTLLSLLGGHSGGSSSALTSLPAVTVDGTDLTGRTGPQPEIPGGIIGNTPALPTNTPEPGSVATMITMTLSGGMMLRRRRVK